MLLVSFCWQAISLWVVVLLSGVAEVNAFGGLEVAAVAGTASFLGWAFNPVGPSPEAAELVSQYPVIRVPELHGILFGDTDVPPKVAIYAGAKVRPESYAPLAQQIISELEGGGSILILQSPFNVYAFKPVSVQKVLEQYPSIRCISGHSIGGIWAMEYCQDWYDNDNDDNSPMKFPTNELSFVYLGVHSSVLSLAQFRNIPFRSVGFTYAANDVTLVNAAKKKEESMEQHIARIQSEELPPHAKVYSMKGGNHSQYGSYGSPSYAQGLAYQDLDATISSKEQQSLIAKAIVQSMQQPSSP